MSAFKIKSKGKKPGKKLPLLELPGVKNFFTADLILWRLPIEINYSPIICIYKCGCVYLQFNWNHSEENWGF